MWEKLGENPMDSIDRKIVAILQAEGRIKMAELSEPVTIFVAVELDNQSTDALQAFECALRQFDQVMECYLMTGTRDILLRVVAQDLTDFDRFLEERLMRVPGIRNTRSSFTLRTMIARNALPQF
jgi:Lrp/AsnC family leucine-responsive transcriptional regulator